MMSFWAWSSVEVCFFITSSLSAPNWLLNKSLIFSNYATVNQAEFVSGRVYKPYVHFFSLDLLVEILKNKIISLQSLWFHSQKHIRNMLGIKNS